MKTTLMQIDLVWADPAANRKKIEAQLAGLPETDLVVLPEMFSTGFMTDPAGRAEKDRSSLKWMKEVSASYGFAICGSVSTEEDGKLYNRFHFVEPSGNVTVYDKRHLFSYSGEDKLYTPGSERVVLEYRGFRILLQVCYDLRFPETARNFIRPDGSADYDLAIWVASWPTRRVDSWSTLLKARAIENQAYVIGVNRVGNDPACEYSGASELFDPMGRSVAACTPGEVSIVTAEIDPCLLTTFRESFPALRDII